MLPYGKFDYVVHLAALKSIETGETYPKNYVETNCWGTLNITERFGDSRFVNISSSSVNEVRSVYGATKQFSEAVVSRLQNSVNLRLYNVFGELSCSGVVKNFINCKLSGISPTIYGDGTQKRDFTYIEDVVSSILYYMKSDCLGTFHLGYGSSISVKELLDFIYGYNVVQYTQLPKRGFDIENSLSPQKMPIIHFGREEGLKRTIESYANSKSRIHA